MKQKSRDFFWYSPVLKRELDHVTADLVVSPKRRGRGDPRPRRPATSRACRSRRAAPAPAITARRCRSSGGVVLNLADMNALKSVARGRVVAEPGAILAEIDTETRARLGEELRLHPSTYDTASIGRLHRRRLGRRRLDQLGRPARHRQRAPPPRRHHGGEPARPRADRAGTCTR